MKKYPIFSEKAFFIFFSVFFSFLILLSGEGICRIFFDIPFLGVSKELFIPKVYGPSKGHAKNAEAMAFGVKVYTDENGFRVPENWKDDRGHKDAAVLILGDSVAFGLGVKEDKTFAGLLRHNLNSIKIYNSSVIGYNINDYPNVVKGFIPSHKEIKDVYLILCLNDLSSQSSKLIDKALNDSLDKPKNSKTSYHALQKINLFRDINQFLRCRSKLYLIIRHLFSDIQKGCWDEIKQLYLVDDEIFYKAMQPVVDISEFLKSLNIRFTGIIIPYPFQFRSNDDLKMFPQKKMGGFFDKYGIEYIDAATEFADLDIEPQELFLPSDPMHLSEKGHDVIFEIIYKKIRVDKIDG